MGRDWRRTVTLLWTVCGPRFCGGVYTGTLFTSVTVTPVVRLTRSAVSGYRPSSLPVVPTSGPYHPASASPPRVPRSGHMRGS